MSARQASAGAHLPRHAALRSQPAVWQGSGCQPGTGCSQALSPPWPRRALSSVASHAAADSVRISVTSKSVSRLSGGRPQQSSKPALCPPPHSLSGSGSLPFGAALAARDTSRLRAAGRAGRAAARARSGAAARAAGGASKGLSRARDMERYKRVLLFINASDNRSCFFFRNTGQRGRKEGLLDTPHTSGAQQSGACRRSAAPFPTVSACTASERYTTSASPFPRSSGAIPQHA